MSWLTGSLTQSVTGRISQISGQLKDILNEGTEDVVGKIRFDSIDENLLKLYSF
jgi:hypothetical protein